MALEGKVALVTGGGRGLGEAITRELTAAGMIVIPADMQEALVSAVGQSLGRENGKTSWARLDVSNPQQVTDVVGKIQREYGRIDVLVNNAGTDKTLSVEELDVEDWNRVIAVNLTGPFLMSKAVFPIMRAQGSGHIINIASTAAKRAWANAAAYHASKWGLLGFSHSLHVEGRQVGIKVTAIVTGGMRTPFLLDRFPDIDINNLQDPANVAKTVRFALEQPDDCVIPELTVIPMRETSWP